MSRTTKSPAERAQENLDVANRLVERLTDKRDRLAQQHEAVTIDLDAAKARRDYLAQNPDLPPVQNADPYVEQDTATR